MAWETIGHAWALDLLKRQLRRGSLHHAYLISGPEGVGRSQLALDFAAALLCETPRREGEGCGTCRACRQVRARAYPDLHVIETEAGKQGISIEQVRELQRHLALSPLGGGRRVAILLDVDQASAGACNALLKTLEEPPRAVVLILTAIDAEGVPATIVSRCESLALRPVAAPDIEAALVGRGVPAADAAAAARTAAGRPGWALRMVEDPSYRDRLGEHGEALSSVLAMDLAERFAVAEAWKDDPQLEERLSLWLAVAGDSLRGSLEGGQAGRADGIGGLGDARSARRAVDAILRALEGMRHHANPRLTVETMMLDLPRVPGN